MTLTEWLRAQLDEDERVALAALADSDVLSGHWKVGNDCVADDQDAMVVDAATSYPQYEQGVLTHIAAWDPARVLAEVKAKRAVLDMDVDEIGDCCPDCGDQAADKVHGVAVHLLAQSYAGREGWRDEWSVS